MKREKFTLHKTQKMPVSKCPRCGVGLDRYNGLQSPMPKEGDVSICVGCGQIMRFRANLTLRALEGEERAELKAYLRVHQPDTLRVLELSERYFIAGRARREN